MTASLQLPLLEAVKICNGILNVPLRIAEYPDEDIEKFLTAHGRDAAVLPPHEVASIIASSDFDPPVLFLQTLFIHAWYTQRTSSVGGKP